MRQTYFNVTGDSTSPETISAHGLKVKRPALSEILCKEYAEKESDARHLKSNGAQTMNLPISGSMWMILLVVTAAIFVVFVLKYM